MHNSLEPQGDTWQERIGFLQEFLQEIKELEEQQNLGKNQDTIHVRATLHSQQDALDVQEGAEGTGRVDS